MTVKELEALARPEPFAARRAPLDARLLGMHRASPVPRRTGDGDVPLTWEQERLWFLHRLGRGGPAYNLFTGLRLQGGLDAVALERALAETVRRHEALRTVFREVDGVPVQVVAPFAGFALPGEDLSELAPAEREAALRRRAAELAAHPFDLQAGPVFAGRLLRLGTGDHALLLSAHHIVGDGWSRRVLVDEVLALYDAFAEGRPSPLPEPALQYGDWAVWQRSQARRQAEAPHLAYWRERLAGAPELLGLSTDRPRPPLPSFRGGRVPVSVPAPVLERLRDLARAEGATLPMVVLAAFKVLLARYSGADDVVVGT
ncbi:MAG TPA: condensation domain-containing protein, partial [Longimicrobium sp.]|nr:condensation domain-containing protein [Longimicrobium sp.]